MFFQMLLKLYCQLSPTRGKPAGATATDAGAGVISSVIRAPAFSCSPPLGDCATTESTAADDFESGLPSTTRTSKPAFSSSAVASRRDFPTSLGTATSCAAGGFTGPSTAIARVTTTPEALRAFRVYVFRPSPATSTHSLSSGFTAPGSGVIVALAAFSTP